MTQEMLEEIPSWARQSSGEPNAAYFCWFPNAVGSEVASSLSPRQVRESGKPQVITESQPGVRVYGLLKEEDIRGLFLKALRSSEKPWGVWVACGTCSAGLARTVLPPQPSSALWTASPWAGLLALSQAWLLQL